MPLFFAIPLHYLFSAKDCLMKHFTGLKIYFLKRRIEKLSTLNYWLEKINPQHREIKEKIDFNQRKLTYLRMKHGKLEFKYNKKLEDK